MRDSRSLINNPLKTSSKSADSYEKMETRISEMEIKWQIKSKYGIKQTDKNKVKAACRLKKKKKGTIQLKNNKGTKINKKARIA